MACNHLNVQGDNYGSTCIDCGAVLSGYGFWGEGSKSCVKHSWVKLNDDPNDNTYTCIFCESEKNDPVTE